MVLTAGRVGHVVQGRILQMLGAHHVSCARLASTSMLVDRHRALPAMWAHLPTGRAARTAGIVQVTHSRQKAATMSRTAFVMRVIVGPMAGCVQPAARARTKMLMGHQRAVLVR